MDHLEGPMLSLSGGVGSYKDTVGFPGGSDGKESACSARDPGSIPGSGRSPGEGKGNSLQYSCLENSMDRGAWRATVHGVKRVRHDSRLNHHHPGLYSLQNSEAHLLNYSNQNVSRLYQESLERQKSSPPDNHLLWLRSFFRVLRLKMFERKFTQN